MLSLPQGDPNVPAGQLTLVVHLNRPVRLPDLERQCSIEELSGLVLGFHEEAQWEAVEACGEGQGEGSTPKAEENERGAAAAEAPAVGVSSTSGATRTAAEPQPFVLPLGVIARNEEYPRSCRMCFYGTGLIAGHGFTSPERTPGLFVLFDDNRFGFIWLELKSFSLYSRLTDPLAHALAPSMERFEVMLQNMQSWTS